MWGRIFGNSGRMWAANRSRILGRIEAGFGAGMWAELNDIDVNNIDYIRLYNMLIT